MYKICPVLQMRKLRSIRAARVTQLSSGGVLKTRLSCCEVFKGLTFSFQCHMTFKKYFYSHYHKEIS